MDLLAPLREQDFSCELLSADEQLHIDLAGRLATDPITRAAEEWFTRAHEVICEQKKKIASIEVDLRKLTFVSSSGIRVFINWIARVRGEPPNKQYTIVLRSNPAHEWQSRSVGALRVLGRGLVAIR